MIRSLKTRLLVLALLAASLTGCYGQTDWATRIGSTSATLNGRGTTDDGAASVYFEYWRSSAPTLKLRTPAKTVRDGVTGPFEAPVSGLTAGESYSFRLCGADPGESAVCANTQTFVAGRPSVRATGSSSVPYGETGVRDVDFNVVGGPAGGRGYMVLYNQEAGPPGGISLPLGSRTDPNITCTRIEGNRAVVGFRSPPSFEEVTPYSSQHYAWLVDGGPAGSGKDRFSFGLYTDGQAPADCPALVDPAEVDLLTHGDVAISDLSAAPGG